MTDKKTNELSWVFHALDRGENMCWLMNVHCDYLERSLVRSVGKLGAFLACSSIRLIRSGMFIKVIRIFADQFTCKLNTNENKCLSKKNAEFQSYSASWDLFFFKQRCSGVCQPGKRRFSLTTMKFVKKRTILQKDLNKTLITCSVYKKFR